MQYSLSVRVAEAATKDRLTMSFVELAKLAKDCGYVAMCMRASAGGVQSSREELLELRRTLDEYGLTVSMATTDIDVPLNNDRGPNNLRNVAPHLDVAQTLGADLIRVCLKSEEDVPWAQRATDAAGERGIRLAPSMSHEQLV